MIYLVAYDIADDRRREAVSVALAAYGARVQLSVFECDVEDVAAATQLKARLRSLIDSAEDQVRLYPLPVSSTREIVILGNRTLEERRDYWIV